METFMRKIVFGLLIFICVVSLTVTAESYQNPAVITAPSGASLRAGPKTSATRLALVPALAEVNILGHSEEHTTVEGVQGCWQKVSWQGKEGYVFAGLLCSDPEEMQQINNMNKLIKRETNRLILTLSNGKTVEIHDKPVFGEESLRCRFKGRLTDQPLYAVEQTGWEWGNILLFNCNDGRRLEVDAMPVFSPGGEKFVTANCDLHAAYNPNRLQIFKMVDGMGIVEWTIEPDAWGPENPHWESETCIKFTRREMDGSERPVSVSYDSDHKSWQLSDQ
jgi:hypothetical protein